MYDDDDLTAAVAAGVMSAETAGAFRDHVAASRSLPAVDEEQFRLITGFNDIFVVIACALLLSALYGIGALVAPWAAAALVAGSSWGLAEFFTRRRRMALPSIMLLITFVGAMLAFIPAVVLSASGGNESLAGSMALPACALATAAAWLHWRRFKVPITIAAGTAAILGMVLAGLLLLVPDAKNWLVGIALVAGIIVFVIAMRWDGSDLKRETRRSDAAFWLHLLAAPLLVHPVFTLLGVFSSGIEPWQAAVVLALYVALGVVSLVIDRRALMVSALSYVIYAFSEILNRYGVVDLSFALTALAIGATLVMLSAFWHGARTALVRRLPPRLQAKVPALR
jgi:hypothetical protein